MFLHLPGGHGLSGQNHLHCPVLSNGSCETLSPASSRHYSDVDLRLGEPCGLGRDDDVTVHGQFAASSVNVPADRPYDRLCDPLQAIPEGELVLLDQHNRSRFR